MKKQAKKLEKIASYFAVFEPDSGGNYNVSFPDFPGCVTFGHSFEEARRRAHELLKIWLEELRAHGEKVPTGYHRPIIDEIRVAIPTRS